MTSTKPENNTNKQARRGVRGAYTFARLKNDIQGTYRPNDRQNSLRAISKKYGVSHSAVQRVLAGIEPKNNRIRTAFGLPCHSPMPVCPKHGIAHDGKCPPKTFEDNAAAYDAWLIRNARKLAKRVAWAESRKRTE